MTLSKSKSRRNFELDGGFSGEGGNGPEGNCPGGGGNCPGENWQGAVVLGNCPGGNSPGGGGAIVWVAICLWGVIVQGVIVSGGYCRGGQLSRGEFAGGVVHGGVIGGGGGIVLICPYLHQTSSVLRRSPLELLSVAGIIYYTCSSVIQYTRHKNAFNKRFKRIVCQNNSAKILSEKNITVCNAVYFRLCIDLMHITPPVTAGGFDGFHHPRCAECSLIQKRFDVGTESAEL